MHDECSVYSCKNEATEKNFLTDGKESYLCRSCAIKVIIKDIVRTSFIPILTFVLLILIGNFLFSEQPPIFRYFLIWVIVGIPFEIKFMFSFIHFGVTIPSMVSIIIINLFFGGLIGGFIAVWRLFVAISNLVKAIVLIKQIMN